jgi:hypothetical protein
MIRVLHVHDDTEQLRYVKRILEATEQGIKVESANSPEEVPFRLLDGTFDAVLSGFWIPVMNEVELGVAVRMVKDTPFIIYKATGRADVSTGTSSRSDGDIVSVEVDPGHIKALADKLVEAVMKNRENRRREVSLKVFRALNHGSDLQSSLGDTLRIIQKGMGINAVGIRLQEGDDYPYHVFDGFHDKHILLENELCATSPREGASGPTQPPSSSPPPPPRTCSSGPGTPARLKATSPWPSYRSGMTVRSSGFYSSTTTEQAASHPRR